jgi:tyrosine-protein kinase Etk/Wzc
MSADASLGAGTRPHLFPRSEVWRRPAAPFDPLELLLRRFRVLLLAAVIALPLGVAHALLAPRWYVSHVTLVPVDNARSSASTLSERPFDSGGDRKYADRLADVIRSRTVASEVIEDTVTDDPDEAHRLLWDRCALAVSRKSSFLTLRCEDPDPLRARDLLRRFVSATEETWQRVSGSSATEERRFLEKRVAQARAEVDESSRKLRAFQEEHRLVDLGEQSRASLTAMASLQSELISKEMQLAYVDAFTAPDESTAQQLRKQVAIVKSRLGSLEGDGKIAESRAQGGGMLPRLLDVPRLRYQYEQLSRDQQAQEGIFLLLTRLFEIAKLSEARDISAFQLLDPPTVAARPSRPNPMLIVAVDTAVALGLVAACILLPAWWRSRRDGAAAATRSSGDGVVGD